jgi:DNA-directed RNA polymerase II subunit RPB2
MQVKLTMALTGDEGRKMSRALIDSYFRTVTYPYTRHHIDSFDQFMQHDLVNIIKTQNPILILKDLIDPKSNTYRYKVEVFVGGESGEEIEIGAPTINLQTSDETRLLFPNEARLRNMTYASSVYANITVKIQYNEIVDGKKDTKILDIPKNTFDRFELFKIPIMLHSRYCVLNNKPREFLTEAGECHYDNGGYFIVDGAEKVLITRQEQAFNTLYVTPQPSDPKLLIYASMTCLSPITRMVKRVAFFLTRDEKTIRVQLPFIRRPVPLFILFRAMGFQSDEEIIRIIFPDFDAPDAKLLLDKLQPSIIEAYPFFNSHLAIEYIKTLTKGFSEIHVLDVIRNQTFIHMSNDPMTQAIFLGDCVRKILRVQEGYDGPTDRDDTRNQRCLVSGFLVQMLFSGVYSTWRKSVSLAIDEEYNYNKGTLYKNENFKNIFEPGNVNRIFRSGQLTDGIMRGFRGKWGSGMGEEKTGVLQALSRLSYCDFMSHCRRVILDFDTGMKLTGPRKLHTSQYGYFCTSETPTGASIGITKNLTIMAAISTATNSEPFLDWLRNRANVYKATDLTLDQRVSFVPVYVNGGMFGYTARPKLLTRVCKLLKRTGCLPYSASVTFSVRDRRVYIYLDEGRPLRPLIWLNDSEDSRMNIQKLAGFKKWRDLVFGNLPAVANKNLDNSEFTDPQKDIEAPKLESYIALLEPHTGVVEYIDPYEQNEAYIANYPDHIRKETTHVEVHPSTILSLMTSQIPFPQHNQSPRNQLSCSQSKQGVSYYATNWQNRFDNTAHVLCYGEAPLTRSMYTNYLGEGKMPYGMNCILAIATWTGYNQEDGIVMNHDALQRGMFRTMGYRSYEAFEEDDEITKTRTRFGNPMKIPAWKDLKPGLDYTKLDDNGFIKEGEFVDENTVIVGAYMIGSTGQISDASVTPQVWTRGRVEKIAITIGNNGLRLIKIRVVQDRIPELGDKFCLTPDHEVFTETGWVNITNVNLNTSVQVLENINPYFTNFNKPTELYQFDNNGDALYTFEMDNGAKQIVTPAHRMLVKTDSMESFDFVTAFELFTTGVEANIYLYGNDGIETKVVNITEETGYTGKVYCFSIPQQTFMVRYKGGPATWTGNSNRHGQKGTIGAMLRGHDMPRTKDGIVPDMIMNPHAIPSRMTIAQNLEQLFGKVAGLTGTIGEATAFMNDGSPEDQIGALLEAVGYERYGNEILYNGATGEQIPAYIFIGPVYGMRLKHMVEDKWQARGKGRKEQKTHQPTGGRGQQGGLKIGEMDRDAIAGHSISAFFKESFMERSDGTKMALCVGCGLQPIYNPKLNISICPLCDGPVRYAGESAGTLELLPPLGRPKSKIVEVEMPYATKVLSQELETYLNIGMRYITTSDVQRFEQLELTATEVGERKELMPLVMTNPVVAERIEPVKETEITLEQLAAMGANLQTIYQEAKPQGDYLQEEAAVGEMQPMGEFGPQNEVMMPGEEMIGGQSMPEAFGPTFVAEANPMPEMGLSQPTVLANALPGVGSPKIIAVDTSPETMRHQAAMLGMPEGPAYGGARRQFRRVPAYGGYPLAANAAPTGMIPGRTEMGEGGEVIKLNASAPIVVQKLG